MELQEYLITGNKIKPIIYAYTAVDDNLPGSRGTTKLVTYSDGSYGVQLNNGTIVGSDW